MRQSHVKREFDEMTERLELSDVSLISPTFYQERRKIVAGEADRGLGRGEIANKLELQDQVWNARIQPPKDGFTITSEDEPRGSLGGGSWGHGLQSGNRSGNIQVKVGK